MASGFKPTMQHRGSAGPLQFEFGAGDWTALCVTTNGNQSHGVVTGLTHIAGGFLVSRDASDEIRIGCITSQRLSGTEVEFTLDDSSEAIDYYFLAGW